MISCDPTGNDDMSSVAWPPVSVPVPIEVEPSMNVTVPVGVSVPEVGDTVAVNVTD